MTMMLKCFQPIPALLPAPAYRQSVTLPLQRTQSACVPRLTPWRSPLWSARIHPGNKLMSYADLAKTIDDAFEARAEIRFGMQAPVREAVEEALRLLDTGALRVAEKVDGAWQVNQWLKKA